MNNIGKQVLEIVEKTVDKKLSNIYYDKTFPSVIYGKNNDGTYKIVREGQIYNVPCTLGYELNVAQHVWVTMPCGAKNFKDMHISGLRGDYNMCPTIAGKVYQRITNEEIDSLFD